MKHTLNKNKDFRRLYRRGKNFAGGYTVIYSFKNRLEHNRIGITTGKTVGNAVTRNRVKRLIREALRLNQTSIKTGYDLVVVARSRAAGKDYSQIAKDLIFVLRKLDLLKNEKVTDNID